MMRVLSVLAVLMACPALATDLENIAYGEAAEQRMDVYVPADVHDAPVILMVHGGAWRFGDKDSRGVVKNKIARWVPHGFIIISANYRMLPAVGPLEQAFDVARALAFAQSQAVSWGGDPRRFILMGHSAGAHLVSLLSADPSLATRFGAQRWLGTISLDSGALDVPAIMQASHARLYDKAFGADPAFWNSTSPLHVLTADALPLLAVCSGIRKDRPCRQAQAYADRATSKGVRAEVLQQALNHAEINNHLGLPGPYTDRVERFMASLDPAVAEHFRAQR
jgi:arylformamidase